MNPSCIHIFDVNELDFMFSGQIEINIEDWKNNTIYKGQYHKNNKVR